MESAVLDIKEFNKNRLNGKRLFLILRNLIKMDWMERTVLDIKEFNKNGLDGKLCMILRNLIKMDWMEREYSWY